MSSFPASQLVEHIRPDAEYQLRSLDGRHVNTVAGGDLLELAEMSLVEGRGNSLKRVRYFQLLVDSQELEKAVVNHASEVRRARAKNPLDVLLDMLRSRSFSSKSFPTVTRRERGEVIASRRAVFYHVGRRCTQPNLTVITAPQLVAG